MNTSYRKESNELMLTTAKNAAQRRNSRNTPPNRLGNSAARTASGAPTVSVGITASGGPLRRVVERGLRGTSGPSHGGSFGSGGGNFFLPERPSITTCRISAVVPLKVRRRYC